MRNPKEARRRYFLHQKAKKFLSINTRDRSITVTDSQVQQFTKRQQNTFNELRNKFHYQIQYEIPN